MIKHMKKILLSGLAVCLSAFMLTSCNDGEDQLTDTRVTHFADLQLQGDELIVLNVGEPYVEPGYTATEGENDITDKVVVSGSVNTNVGGFYDLVYSVANTDHFSNSVTRTVMVVNPNGLASAYWGSTQFYGPEAPIIITDNGDGTYTIDDLMAGYYFYYNYPGYEPTYDFHLEAIVTLNDDNTLTQVGAGSWYFSSKPTVTNGVYDPSTGTVSWVTSNGLSVQLTK